MISERYLFKLSVLISCMKVGSVAVVTAVLRRLMKAVFFLRALSRALATGKTSMVLSVAAHLALHSAN